MTTEFVFSVLIGPIDDFEKQPTVLNHRDVAINACVEAFRTRLLKAVKDDESLVQWSEVREPNPR